jgi:hypothetical protein
MEGEMDMMCSMYERDKKYIILARKLEGKRPLGRPRSRWEGNIRLNLSGRGWEGMDYIHMAQEREQW